MIFPSQDNKDGSWMVQNKTKIMSLPNQTLDDCLKPYKDMLCWFIHNIVQNLEENEITLLSSNNRHRLQYPRCTT